MVEGPPGSAAGGYGLHFQERAPQVEGGNAPDLAQLGAFVLVGAQEMGRQLARPGAGLTLDDHGRGPGPRRA